MGWDGTPFKLFTVKLIANLCTTGRVYHKRQFWGDSIWNSNLGDFFFDQGSDGINGGLNCANCLCDDSVTNMHPVSIVITSVDQMMRARKTFVLANKASGSSKFMHSWYKRFGSPSQTNRSETIHK